MQVGTTTGSDNKTTDSDKDRNRDRDRDRKVNIAQYTLSPDQSSKNASHNMEH